MNEKEPLLPIERGWKTALKIYSRRLLVFLLGVVMSLLVLGITLLLFSSCGLGKC